MAEQTSNRRAASDLDINESMIRKWRMQKNKLEGCNKKRKSFRTCRARWAELEEDLAEWVEVKRAGGHGVNTVQVRLKAKEMAEEKALDNFTGNATWCFRFMRRQNLSIRVKTTVSQQEPSNL